MKKTKLDKAFIWGAVWAGPAAAAVNFPNALRGGTPAWYNVAASLLLMVFWVTWLVRYRSRRRHLLTSLWLTVGFIAVTLLVILWQFVRLPLMLEVTMYLGVALFFVPYGGLTEWIGETIKETEALYLILLSAGVFSLAIHGYYLHRLKEKEGAAHEA